MISPEDSADARSGNQGSGASESSVEELTTKFPGVGSRADRVWFHKPGGKIQEVRKKPCPWKSPQDDLAAAKGSMLGWQPPA